MGQSSQTRPLAEVRSYHFGQLELDRTQSPNARLVTESCGGRPFASRTYKIANEHNLHGQQYARPIDRGYGNAVFEFGTQPATLVEQILHTFEPHANSELVAAPSRTTPF